MRFISVLLISLFTFSAYAADMPLISLDGLMKEIKSHSGKTMVVFWAPWCPHCIRELRVIRDNPKFVADNGLQIIALTKECDRRSAVEFAKSEKMPFRFFLGEKEVYNKLQKIDAFPLTIVFKNDGTQHDLEYGKQSIEDLQLMLLD